MKSAGKARNNGLYRHIRTSKEIIRNLLNDSYNVSENFSCLLCGRYRPQNTSPGHHMVRRGLPNYLVYQYFPFGTMSGAPESGSFITMQLS